MFETFLFIMFIVAVFGLMGLAINIYIQENKKEEKNG